VSLIWASSFYKFVVTISFMKNLTVFCVIIYLLLGCSTDVMVINGVVPATYNGQTVFLVPRPDPVPGNVDSMKVSNGRFSFRVEADSIRVCDITISRKARAHVEKLLIVVEPGKLDVKIDTVSSSNGTPLNDELQLWKEAMQETGKRSGLITLKIEETSNDSIKQGLMADRQRLYNDFGITTFEFVKRNMNPLGGYIYMIMSPLFDSLQRVELKNIGIEKWEPKEKLR